ncbi:YiiX/YebB-like N1pC/P60 family cysteine hydrolase [Myroides odoratus]|uniref:YiiX/YebB-like N1pC/P60 family cysteine hydrolase n=1 Tax=Myroides odoratus TaxID=256 RepID=UPI000765D24A|nr:YiiX/YebB-like N1pC/P60 family cysteine hydrolase [Myroides odoratus]
MKKILALIVLLSTISYAQQTTFKEGDLIFQNLKCSPLCDAINEVTYGYEGLNFNHIGMVIEHEGSLQVIEATWPEVCITPLNQFLNKTPEPSYLGRLVVKHEKLIPQAKAFALEQLGVPYDENYLYANSKYYCSELIYDAFKAANKNKEFFRMYPMTYKSKYTGEYFPVWVQYFEKLDQIIPEGSPGCNPASLSWSKNITIVGPIVQ